MESKCDNMQMWRAQRNLFELAAVLTLNRSGYDKGIKEAAEEADSFGSKLKAGLGNAAKAAGAAITAAAGAAVTAVSAMSKKSLDAYANYEQLVGGVETLFGAGGKSLEEYAKEQGKTIDEVKDEYNSMLETQKSVLDNADKAYKTAGLSANEYMETVTSFSAALIQSTGRGEQQDIDQLEASLKAELKATKRTLEDQYKEQQESWKQRIAEAKKNKDANIELLQQQRDEELKALKRANEDKLAQIKAANEKQVKAATASNNASTKTADSIKKASELADLAIVDMADNANKMGTSMEAVQNAYQGFAKANYTMLDNLKLGYGGTKEEMQRLLRDASELANVEYNLNSYADIVEAIHVIQNEMGITGTTSKEASATISGSVASMKSAWENFTVELAKGGGGNIGGLLTDLANSAITAAQNIIPRIEEILGGISTAIEQISPLLSEKIIPMLTDDKLITSVLNAGVKLIDALIDGITKNVKPITDAAFKIVTTLFNGITKKLPDIVKAGLEIVKTLAEGISENISEITQTITDVALEIEDVLTDPDTLTGLLDAGLDIILGLADGIMKAIPKIVDKLPVIIENIVQFFNDNLQDIIDAGVTLISSIVSNLPAIIKAVTDAIPKIITALTDKEKGLLSPTNIQKMIDGGLKLFEALVNNIDDIVSAIADSLPKIIDGLLNGVKGLLSKENLDTMLDGGIKPFKGLVSSVGSIVSALANGLKDLVTGIGEKIGSFASDLINSGIELGENIISGIADAFKDFDLMNLIFGKDDGITPNIMKNDNPMSFKSPSMMQFAPSANIGGTTTVGIPTATVTEPAYKFPDGQSLATTVQGPPLPIAHVEIIMQMPSGVEVGRQYQEDIFAAQRADGASGIYAGRGR